MTRQKVPASSSPATTIAIQALGNALKHRLDPELTDAELIHECAEEAKALVARLESMQRSEERTVWLAAYAAASVWSDADADECRGLANEAVRRFRASLQHPTELETPTPPAGDPAEVIR
jgi:hypothetical protein